MMAEAMEITTFKLSKGVTMKDFIAANAVVDAWLKKRHGFIMRRMCQGKNGRVTDMLLWASAKDGERAASDLMTELSNSPVHAAIDQSSVDWSVTVCRHRVN
jgi:hypothetical protein